MPHVPFLRVSEPPPGATGSFYAGLYSHLSYTPEIIPRKSIFGGAGPEWATKLESVEIEI